MGILLPPHSSNLCGYASAMLLEPFSMMGTFAHGMSKEQAGEGDKNSTPEFNCTHMNRKCNTVISAHC